MICHDRRFIFVHAGRTGGSSIERAAGVGRTTDPRTRDLGNTDFAEKHASFQHYRQTYPAEFNDYYRFTFVRNPFDRLVSAWVWRTQVVRDLPPMPLAGFIETRGPGWSFCEKFRLEGMSLEQSVATFDFIGRFERLAEGLQHLQRRLGIPCFPDDGSGPTHVNRTVRPRYQDAYDDATIALVRRHFAGDLELFGYDFGD